MWVDGYIPTPISCPFDRERLRQHFHLVGDDVVRPNVHTTCLFDLFDAGTCNLPVHIVEEHGLAVERVCGEIQVNLIEHRQAAASNTRRIQNQIAYIDRQEPTHSVTLQERHNIASLDLADLESVHMHIAGRIAIIIFQNVIAVQSEKIM